MKQITNELVQLIQSINYENKSYSLEDIYAFLEKNGIETKNYCPGMSVREYLEDLVSIGALRYQNGKYSRKEKFKKCERNIVCLCGSTKFKDAFKEAEKTEALKGNIVVTVAMFGHLEGLDMSSEAKQIFDDLHFEKIKLADEVFVLNVGGYIGESTKREIDFAKSIGKRIRYLE